MKVKTVKGFKVIPLRFSKASTAQHDLFVKKHAVRYEAHDKPVDHTIFVLNVPPYTTEDSFKAVFSCVGQVTNVIFQDRPSSKESEEVKLAGFKVAYVVFEKVASVEQALNLTSLGPLSTDEHPVLTGVQKWVKEYNSNIYNHAKLEEGVSEFMARYDKEEKKRKEQEKNKDDGGWTVVAKKGRNPGLSRKQSVENKLLEKTNKGVKRKQLDDFYTFQKREKKMKDLIELRKKHEQDKKKVEAMKQARKFKPF